MKEKLRGVMEEEGKQLEYDSGEGGWRRADSYQTFTTPYVGEFSRTFLDPTIAQRHCSLEIFILSRFRDRWTMPDSIFIKIIEINAIYISDSRRNLNLRKYFLNGKKKKLNKNNFIVSFSIL